MRKRLWLKLFWLMVLTALVVAGCDSSDDDNGGPVAEPSPGPAQTLTVSGQAVDDPVAGADVMVKNLSGRLLGAGVTDAEGFYAVTVLRSDAEAGYSIEVSGGTVADAPFSGTLRADYGPGDDPGAANVTPLTSLVSVAAENGAGDSALQRRDAAVEMIENIGMVREGEWMKTAPGFVDVGALRPFIAQMGFDEWVQVMAGDLEDGELSDGMMVGFPHAHGGIRDAGLAGGGGEVEMGPGGSFSGRVDAAAPEGAVLQYELVNAPAGMRVDESGEIAYAVPADAPAGSRIPFAVRVSDPETGFGRVVHGAIVIPPEGTVPAVDADGDGYTVSDGDCNDADASIYPGAEEICGDGIDQDCDGLDAKCSDEMITWYKDADGDGYSDGTTQEAPEKPEGYGSAESLTRTSGDCNDADAAIHPGAEDICGDGIDQDCDGADAECPGEMITWYKDADGDFYSDGTTQEAVEQPAGYYRAEDLTAISGDCDDAEPTVHPGAVEICGDGIDQDCTGGDEACYTPPAVIDNDGDGYSVNQGDCNDYDRSVHPGADEICGDNIDNNCNGIIDEGCVQPDSTPPEFFGIDMASTTNADAVFLSWLPATDDDTDSDPIQYRIYYDTTAEFEPDAALLYEEVAGQTEITVTGLDAGTLYHFLALAVDAAGNVSQERNYKSVATADTPMQLRESVTLKKPAEMNVAPPVVDDATGQYVFDSAQADDFSQGDYIVGRDSEGNGYLRQVDGVTMVDGKAVLETSQASMADVVESLRLDNVISLRELDAEQVDAQGTTRRSGGSVVTRQIASSGGGLQVTQIDYVDRNPDGVSGPMPRSATPRRLVSSLDPTGELKLIAQDKRQVRPGSTLFMPLEAYLVDENGQMQMQQQLGIKISLVALTNQDVEDNSSGGNYGAYYNEDKGELTWKVLPEHVSDYPYMATIRAETIFTGLKTDITVEIYVLDPSAYASDFETNQEAGVNVDFGFEPNLRTSLDVGTFGGIKEGEIVASGEFFANIEAWYNFSAAKSWEKQKQFFKRTWVSSYPVGPLLVLQKITFTLDAKLSANAQAAISANAFAGARARLEIGTRYNPETEEWELVKGANFDKELTFNLGVEGSVGAELRLIPKISVTFYEIATADFYMEPYIAASAGAEWIQDGDVLRQIVISQYQMTDMSAWVGIDCFFGADLSIWKFELWSLEKTALFEFKYDLFNLPELELSAGTPDTGDASLLLSAHVKDGKNNPFDPESVSWNAWPAGRFLDQAVITDPEKPGEATYTVKFLTSRADDYRIFFSGNSRFGVITRQYKEVARSIGQSQLQGVPTIINTTSADGEITVEWEADPETAPDPAFTLYFAKEPGVTPDNYTRLSGGTMFTNAESPLVVPGLDNGTEYFFVLTATDALGESDPSAEMTATPAPAVQLPAAPANLTAAAGDGQATLSWDAVENADSYKIHYGGAPGVSSESNDGTLTAQQPGFVHEGLTNGQTYYYVVAAVSAAGEGPASAEASATPQAAIVPPAAPGNLSATAGDGQATLSWDAVSGADAYKIYFAAAPGVSETVNDGMLQAQQPSFVHEGLTNGQTYHYVVAAVNAAGDSPLSVEVSATPQAAVVPPDSPTNVTATAGDGKVTLSWDAMANAVSYNIYMAEESGVGSSNYSGLSGGQQIAGVSGPYAVEGLTNGTTYYFAVTSVGADGSESHPESGEVNATPAAAVIGDTISDNSNLGMTLVRIPAGPFYMGSPAGEPGRWTDGREDQHPVTIANDFYLMTTEVTNAQFVAFLNAVGQRGTTEEPWFYTQSESTYSKIMGDVGSFSVEAGFENHPAVNISWYGAKAMAEWLSTKEGKNYRLPTEAEWEYAARANPGAGENTKPFAFGGCLSTDQANYDGRYPLSGCPSGEYRGGTVEVGTLGKNAWNLADMHGNVWEWVEDHWHSTYDGAPSDGSAWVDVGGASGRVIRGGSWLGHAQGCRSADRLNLFPTDRYYYFGFRLALSPSR